MTKILVILLTTIALIARGTETVKTNTSVSANKNTNEIDTTIIIVLNDLKHQQKSDEFWKRYLEEVDDVGSRIFLVDFGPKSSVRWVQRIESKKYGVWDTFDKRGAKLFFKTSLDSMREAVSTLKEEEWKEYGKELISPLWRGTVGNTVEERDNMVSSIPSYASEERTSSETFRGKHNFERGIRPWNGYTYCGFDIGKIKDHPIARIDSRFYTPIDARIGEYWIAEKITFPISEKTQIIFGGWFVPDDLDSEKHPPSASVRWERRIGGDKDGGLVSIGIKCNKDDSQISITIFKFFR